MFKINLKPYMIKLSVLCIFLFILAKLTLSKEIQHMKYDIEKVLEPDVIRSIKNPDFVSASKTTLHPDEPVIGVSINGDSRAYSTYLLNSHEIVNDVVGGKPVAITW